MLQEFIQHVQKTAQPLFREVNNATFALWPDGTSVELIPESARAILPQTLKLNSLDAMVHLVKTEAMSYANGPIYITASTHLTACCFMQPCYDKRAERAVLYVANATDVPGWEDKTTLPFEEMQIALRTRFQDQESQDMIYTRQLLSEISTGAKIVYNDNGVATSVVTRKGVDLQANQPIRPFVTLRPYRTFQEVEQPSSVFLIRISERGISLMGADGGMWKLHARETIKAFLQTKLDEEVKAGKVIVAL